MKNILLFTLCAVALMSCGHFHDEPTKSVWAGCLWIIPLATALGSAFFLYRSLIKSKTGSERQTPSGYEYSDKNIPFYRQNVFIFSVILFAATIGIIIAVNNSK